MQERKEYFEKIFTDMWQKYNVNGAMATDLTIYICDLANAEEPNWSEYQNFEIDVNFPSDLSNALLLDIGNKGFLFRFLNAFLSMEKYDLIYKFFDKAFVSHVCSTNFSSRNSANFGMSERSFDRFIEAIRFVGIAQEEIMSMLIFAVTSNSNALVNRWQRPSADYLIDIVRQNDGLFSSFIISNFDKVGIEAFEFLFTISPDLALQNAITLYKSNIVARPSLRSFIKRHDTESIKAIEKSRSNNDISMAVYVDLLLIFASQKDLEQKFFALYNEMSEPQLKRAILENVNIPLEKTIKNLAQFNRACNRFEGKDNRVLGKKLSEYPILIMQDGEPALIGTTPLILTKYIELCSPKSYKEVEYFKDYLSQDSLDELCKDIFDSWIKYCTKDDDWAVTLISSNMSIDTLIETMKRLFEICDDNSDFRISQFINICASIRKNEIVEIMQKLDKTTAVFPRLSAYLLESIKNEKVLNYWDYGILCDTIVPTFGLDSNGCKQFKCAQDVFDINVIDGNTVNIDGVDGAVVEDLSAKNKADLLRCREEILQEISKQSRRFEKDFFDNRKWSKPQFLDIVLKNPILKVVANGLLWAEYVADSIVKIFCIKNDKIEDIVCYKNVLNESITIGIFHPVESSGQEWLEVFVPKFTPFNQLQRDIYSMDKFTKLNSVVSRFNGTIVNFDKFEDRMRQTGWVYGITNKLNKVSSMIKVNDALQILCEIDFSPIENGIKGQEVMLGELRFYRLKNAIMLGESWKTSKINSMEITTIPPRLFSDIIYEIAYCSKK